MEQESISQEQPALVGPTRDESDDPTLIPIKKGTRNKLRAYLPMGSYDFGLNFLMTEHDALKAKVKELEKCVIELSVVKY